MNPPDPEQAIARLLAIMARLRDPAAGCPWDLEQDFASIAPYTIEEAYEVADAIDRGDFMELRSELGDLLFQVVFHAQMASEAGLFDFSGVVTAISEKMIRRHPHVFADARVGSAADQRAAWEQHKAAERGRNSDQSALAGIELGIPALSRAAKLGKRAAGRGFDWPDADGVMAKVSEELQELKEAHDEQDAGAAAEELGDLLFAVANLARHLGVDAEEALRQANRKFERRFRGMESLQQEQGEEWPAGDAAALESLWESVKRRE